MLTGVHFGGEHFIFFGALLVLGSVLLGMLSTRIGAPLLLVFLGLGMLAGEDGVAQVRFNDFGVAYTFGSIALAVILFDGGLRTKRRTFELAAAPAIGLATIGVLLTAVICGAAAMLFLGFNWIGGFLVGATIASTDAAAVFLLLHQRGTEIKERVNATLEVESGLNDPMAVFLTVIGVELLSFGNRLLGWEIAAQFAVQLFGGAVIGLGGGLALVRLINRIEIAAGLYPIVAAAAALAIFGGAQLVGASGFLAVYLAGLVMGNRKHRAAIVINRFFDGLAWLCQIGMFLMLGLLVTPRFLLADLLPAIGIALVLIFVARPLAVFICLLPFRFSREEVLFISWVGLRGAVPIFLASLPVLAEIPGGFTYFNVAFVVVLTSLVVQGWTVGPAARLLKLELPQQEEASRLDFDALTGYDRDIAGYRVAPNSPALMQKFANLHLPSRVRILSVIREGVVQNRENLERLEPGDYVLCVAPPEQLHALDTLFAARKRVDARADTDEVFGEFTVSGEMQAGQLASFYSFTLNEDERALTLSELMNRRIGHRPGVGDRVSLGLIELIVREVAKGKVKMVGVELEPEDRRVTMAELKRRVQERMRARWLRRGKGRRRGD
ncbi:MAG: potassium/proton antiporter [Alphaproteobacteria bacterium]|nr:potassium/proton antiporter [Alphaproteobacteria bacterium]